MKLDRFINRPVLSTVISILIVILGAIGLATLPITQYPDIAPPTVSVRATYTGASASTVLNSVIAPLEEQINGVENMMYMTSTASNTGSGEISIYFKQGTDPDMAAVNVQNRVSMAQGLLPAEVTKVGVTTQKRQTSMLVVFSLYDETDTYSESFIENYAKINLIPQVQRVQGVGDANVLGQDYSMRIWLRPDVMAQYKLLVMFPLLWQNKMSKQLQDSSVNEVTKLSNILSAIKDVCNSLKSLKISLSNLFLTVKYSV
jgi:HAE1 family hydrophobic/amphiphilic exporter-1